MGSARAQALRYEEEVKTFKEYNTQLEKKLELFSKFYEVQKGKFESEKMELAKMYHEKIDTEQRELEKSGAYIDTLENNFQRLQDAAVDVKSMLHKRQRQDWEEEYNDNYFDS